MMELLVHELQSYNENQNLEIVSKEKLTKELKKKINKIQTCHVI
jgi:hypothetical protein